MSIIGIWVYITLYTSTTSKNPVIFDHVKYKGDLNFIIPRDTNFENIFIYDQVLMKDLTNLELTSPIPILNTRTMVKLTKFIPTSIKFSEDFILAGIKNVLNNVNSNRLEWQYISNYSQYQKEAPEKIKVDFIVSKSIIKKEACDLELSTEISAVIENTTQRNTNSLYDTFKMFYGDPEELIILTIPLKINRFKILVNYSKNPNNYIEFTYHIGYQLNLTDLDDEPKKVFEKFVEIPELMNTLNNTLYSVDTLNQLLKEKHLLLTL